jgi:hypothetical protein
VGGSLAAQDSAKQREQWRQENISALNRLTDSGFQGIRGAQMAGQAGIADARHQASMGLAAAYGGGAPGMRSGAMAAGLRAQAGQQGRDLASIRAGAAQNLAAAQQEAAYNAHQAAVGKAEAGTRFQDSQQEMDLVRQTAMDYSQYKRWYEREDFVMAHWIPFIASLETPEAQRAAASMIQVRTPAINQALAGYGIGAG